MATAVLKKVKKKLRKGEKTKPDDRNEHVLPNSTPDKTEKRTSLKLQLEDEKLQKQLSQPYCNSMEKSKGSPKLGKQNTKMSHSLDDPGPLDCPSDVPCPNSSQSVEVGTTKECHKSVSGGSTTAAAPCAEESQNADKEAKPESGGVTVDGSRGLIIPAAAGPLSAEPQNPVNSKMANVFTSAAPVSSNNDQSASDGPLIVVSQNTENGEMPSSGVIASGHAQPQANQPGTATSTGTRDCQDPEGATSVNAPTAQVHLNEAKVAADVYSTASQWPGPSNSIQGASGTLSTVVPQNITASGQSSQVDQAATTARDFHNPERGTSANASMSGVPRNEDDNNPQSLTHPPVQEEQQSEAEDGLTGEVLQNEATVNDYEHFFVSEKINGNKFLQDKLTVGLDRTSHRVIKTWEHLACTKEIAAPLEVILKCKINSANSCTMVLFDVVTAEHDDTKVKDFMDALTRMKRNDVKKIITGVCPDAANSVEKLSDFLANSTNSTDISNAIAQVATFLDQKSTVTQNWRQLGHQLKLTNEQLREIEYGQFTQVLMEYLYSKKTDWKIGTFYQVIEKLKRQDVLKILQPFIANEGDRDKLMKDVIPLESDIMRSICVCLNSPNPVIKNWRHLAKCPELGIPDEVYKDCRPGKPKSPTEALLEWTCANRTELTIGQLCCALKGISRNDIVRDIKQHFQQEHRGSYTL